MLHRGERHAVNLKRCDEHVAHEAILSLALVGSVEENRVHHRCRGFRRCRLDSLLQHNLGLRLRLRLLGLRLLRLRLLRLRLQDRNIDHLFCFRCDLWLSTLEHEGPVEEGEGLMFLRERNRCLLSIVVRKHLRIDKLKPSLCEHVRDLSKRHKCLVHGLLETLELHGNHLTKLLVPRISIRIPLLDLSEDLAVGTKQSAFLAQQTRIDSRSVHARSKEHALAVVNQILHKDLEGLLRCARIMHRHLARHRVEHLQTRELLEIRRRSWLQTGKNADIPIVLLIQRLRHVSHDKQCRRERSAVSLTKIADARTLHR